MAHRVCPFWVGYLLINPLRRLFENPYKILDPIIREGMTILEPGCGMGYFTLPIARMVGPDGRVVVVEIQEKMLISLERRAKKAGLSDRIESRLIESDGMGITDLSGMVDLVVAIHMIHEVPNQRVFFSDVWEVLKSEGRLLAIEPKGHVSKDKFEQSISIAEQIGFMVDVDYSNLAGRKALLIKSHN